MPPLSLFHKEAEVQIMECILLPIRFGRLSILTMEHLLSRRRMEDSRCEEMNAWIEAFEPRARCFCSSESGCQNLDQPRKGWEGKAGIPFLRRFHISREENVIARTRGKECYGYSALREKSYWVTDPLPSLSYDCDWSVGGSAPHPVSDGEYLADNLAIGYDSGASAAT